MNQSQHTPGPWSVGEESEYTGALPIVTADGELIPARVAWFKSDQTGAVQSANACLIAAAPDLLAALENLSIVAGAKVDYCGTSWYATSLAGSAVAGPCSTEAEAIAAHRSVIEMHIADAEAAIKAARGEQ